MRQPFIDNLRGSAILLLFPLHTLMVWNDFGSRYYIWVKGDRLLSAILVLITPWLMPLLFVLAGISARYALRRYPVGEFIRRRCKKLLPPFLWGTVLLCPLMTCCARKYLEGYTGGFWENWGYFFTHATDLSGYDGGFTPGHLWFILFLLLISMVTLPLFVRFPCDRLQDQVRRLPLPGLLLLFLPIWAAYFLGNFGGYSLGKGLAHYLAGYYLLGDAVILERLEKDLSFLLKLWGGASVGLALLYYCFAYYGDLWVTFTGWTAILALLPLAKRHWNQENRFTRFLRRRSYSIYILHQPILVLIAYVVVRGAGGIPQQIAQIWAGSLLLTAGAAGILPTLSTGPERPVMEENK